MVRHLGWTVWASLALVAAPAFADVKAGVDLWAKGDWKGAIDQWRQPAIAGDADAQFNMGKAYQLGRGVPLDPSIAEGWFKKAAMQGHPQAEANLGLALFQDGKTDAALPWLDKAAKRDERRAQLVLGTMLFNGDGVPKDYPRAYALVTRSSQQGLPQAAGTLAQMDRFIPADQRARGTEMAKQIESDAKFAALGSAPIVPNAPDEALGTKPLAGVAPVKTATPAKTPPAVKAAAKSAQAKPVSATTAKAEAKPAPKPETPKPAILASGGKWRIQLGAFKADGAAQAQWKKLAGRMSGASPSYEKAGPVTRLVATGFASSTQANQACAAAKKAGAACLVIAP
ncbi:Sporulation protein [Sphingomonas sp. EC-HK361]|uniref:SPOR domain-containing protein n=1 Tax=Sphingomonas sp. EC-HK361 TaxID=2038397 RepID=UPI001252A089|nr:SPOR domain-containing protein [Sphingomonas sp. EC-HK361]VVT11615.1 Sporulation protein [Sphingomonas sp. EC-HK361]